MALTLLGAGLLLVVLRDGAARALATDRATRFSAGMAWLPLLTATLVIVGGVLVATGALTAL